jgi:hypothetical protein
MDTNGKSLLDSRLCVQTAIWTQLDTLDTGGLCVRVSNCVQNGTWTHKSLLAIRLRRVSKCPNESHR